MAEDNPEWLIAAARWRLTAEEQVRATGINLYRLAQCYPPIENTSTSASASNGQPGHNWENMQLRDLAQSTLGFIRCRVISAATAAAAVADGSANSWVRRAQRHYTGEEHHQVHDSMLYQYVFPPPPIVLSAAASWTAGYSPLEGFVLFVSQAIAAGAVLLESVPLTFLPHAAATAETCRLVHQPRAARAHPLRGVNAQHARAVPRVRAQAEMLAVHHRE